MQAAADRLAASPARLPPPRTSSSSSASSGRHALFDQPGVDTRSSVTSGKVSKKRKRVRKAADAAAAKAAAAIKANKHSVQPQYVIGTDLLAGAGTATGGGGDSSISSLGSGTAASSSSSPTAKASSVARQEPQRQQQHAYLDQRSTVKLAVAMARVGTKHEAALIRLCEHAVTQMQHALQVRLCGLQHVMELLLLLLPSLHSRAVRCCPIFRWFALACL